MFSNISFIDKTNQFDAQDAADVEQAAAVIAEAEKQNAENTKRN